MYPTVICCIVNVNIKRGKERQGRRKLEVVNIGDKMVLWLDKERGLESLNYYGNTIKRRAEKRRAEKRLTLKRLTIKRRAEKRRTLEKRRNY